MFYNKDIRTIGSGNIGATNVLRAGYKILALITILCDSLKGLVAIIVAKKYFNADFTIYAGLFAILGHMYPVWLKLKGGKGVATFFGVILAINPQIFMIALVAWLITAVISKYSSLSAIFAIISFPISCYYLQHDVLIVAIGISILVLYKHKDNISRLINGNETKIKFRKKVNDDD
jgi:glycerol-3-phosphate acyltransferase PlsY